MRTALILLLIVIASPLFACRIILPPPWPPAPPEPEPLRAMEVREHRAEVRLRDQVAEVLVDVTFYNPNARRIEGTYFFPIDPRAAVSSFSMTVNGKTLEARILPAAQARKTYEDIVRRLEDPAILEYLDHGMLKARVFPLEARGEVRIRLAYEQVVQEDGGLVRFRYPLLSARPGGDNPIAKLEIDLQIDTRAPLKTLYTPGFASRIERPADHRGRVAFTANHYRPEQDFELVYGTAAGVAGANVLAYREDDQGTFLLMVAPRSELQQDELAAKDITFVIDTSGSMQGDKIEQARKALRFGVNGLNPADRFNVIRFATDVVPLAPEPLPATPENRRRALAFIDDLRARGGTAIDDAVAAALAASRRDDAVPLVVFITDGLPTIGRIEHGEILDRFARTTPQRFFTFGVGDDVDTRLLNAVADETRGHVTYVRPGENLEIALSSFFDKVASPVMTDLELRCADATLSQLQPRRLPDLFRGQQLVVTGRYRGRGETRFELSGRVGDRRETVSFIADLDGDSRNAFVRRLWAIRRVAWLEDQVRIHGEKDELVDEIRRLGKEFGIVTPYTSMLIVEQTVQLGAAEQTRVRRDLQRLEGARAAGGAAAADYAESLAGAKNAPVAAAAPSQPGAVALRQSLRLAPAEFEKLVRTAGDLTFYRRVADSRYIDSRLDLEAPPTPDVTVRAWSAEFFELLARHPELRRYMMLEHTFLVRLDDRIVEVRWKG